MSAKGSSCTYFRFKDSRKIISFAMNVIADGKVRGQRIKIGRIKALFGKRRYRKYGFEQSAPLYLTDDTIVKYINHPKGKKGATVPVRLLPAIVLALNNPRRIYQDISSKNSKNRSRIYVVTINHPEYRKKVIKAVIHIDYSRGGYVFHNVKSFGIVDVKNMRDKVYRKIK